MKPPRVVVLPLIACLLMFAGCSSTIMTVDSDDPRTGKSTHKVYSKYYDEGRWLIPNHVGIVAVVDHEKTRVPVVYDAQRFMGALGPDDSQAMGKMTIYIWNFDSQPHAVKILRITSGSEVIAPQNGIINALPNTKTGAIAGRIKIFDSGIKIPMMIEYELNGRRSKIDLVLPRRTEEDLAKYFGPGGVPPYPWGRTGNKIQ